MREIEPHAGGVAALHVPQEGIVDYAQVCAALVKKIEAAGGRVITNTRVIKLERRRGAWIAKTSLGPFEAAFLVNCGGLQCDRVAQMAGERRDMRILPFRGEYYRIKRERQSLVRNLIYPVPDPRFPFLGVHFTRLIHGGIEAGPNAVLAFAREGYRKTDFNPRDLWDSLSYPGLWRFLRRYPSMAWFELRRSFSRELFSRSLQRLVPDIRPEDLDTGGAGVRAQAITPNGELEQDFRFIEREGALHVLNAPSPGATASLAIGHEIVARMGFLAPSS
jgi:L-2-hydroxyglutarate oxidase